MKFGRERGSLDGGSMFSGISPMASRRCSVDEQEGTGKRKRVIGFIDEE